MPDEQWTHVEQQILRNAIQRKQWREVTIRELVDRLPKEERRRRRASIREIVELAYKLAGAGYSGRFQE